MKRIIKKALTALASLALVICLLDLACYIFFYFQLPMNKITIPDPYAGYRLKAHAQLAVPVGLFSRSLWKGDYKFHVRTNELGFRSEDFNIQKPPGTVRMIFMGDSCTFGYDVEEEQAYPSVVASILSTDRPGLRFESYNCGLPAYTTHQALVRLSRELLKYRPDIVVFTFGYHEKFPGYMRTWCPLPYKTDRELMPGDPFSGFKPISLGSRDRLQLLFRKRSLFIEVKYLEQTLSSLVLLAGITVATHNPQRGHINPGRGKPAPCRVPLDDYRKDLEELFALGRSYGFLPVVANLYQTPREYIGLSQKICGAAGVPFLDFHDLFVSLAGGGGAGPG